MSVNEAIFVGVLCNEPILTRTYPENIPVCTARIAVERDWKDRRTGRRESDFFNLAFWKKKAEPAMRGLHKGDFVVVKGRLKVKEYTTREGEKRTSLTLDVDRWYRITDRRHPAVEEEETAEPDDLPF